jgi:glycogen synthase
VEATSKLEDTIKIFFESGATGTGFLLEDLTDSALYDTISRACDLYRRFPEVITAMYK